MRGKKGTKTWEPFNVYVNGRFTWAYLGAKANGQKMFLCAIHGPREAPTRKEVAFWLASQTNTTIERAMEKVGTLALQLGKYVLSTEDKLRFTIRVCFRPNPEFGRTPRQCVEVVSQHLGLKFGTDDPIPALALWGKIHDLF